MKRILRILIKITVIVGGLSVLGVFVFIQYLKSDLNQSIPSHEVEKLVNEIHLAESVPVEFQHAFSRIYRSVSTTEYLLNNFTDNSLDPVVSPSLWLARSYQTSQAKSDRIMGNAFVLSWKLEKRVSQLECLNYIIQNFDFLYDQTGLEEASQFYFNSETTSLTSEQWMVLALMTKNPALYNPRRRPELIERTLNQYLDDQND